MNRPGTDEIFFPETVKLETGFLELPVFSLRLEHRVRSLMVRAFDALPEDEQLRLVENFFSPPVLAKFFAKNPSLWIRLGSEVFGQSEDWIRTNVTMAEIFSSVLRRLAPPKRPSPGEDEPQAESPSEGWSLARTIEFAAQEWSWTQDDVLDCSHVQLVALLDACANRYDEADKAAERDVNSSGKRSSRRRGVKPATSDPERGEDGLGSVRAFAQRGGLNIKQS